MTVKANYQIVQSESINDSEPVEYRTVYSILALYPHGDVVDSELVYDVSRESCVAERVLRAARREKPSIEQIWDFVSELL